MRSAVFTGAMSTVILVGVMLSAPAAATDYYVNAATGSDTNDGLSSGSPWKTIQKAVNVAGAGDTCRVSPGDYPGRVYVRHSGMPGRPLVLRAEGPGAVVEGFTVRGFGIVHHVVIQGFEITLPRRASLDAETAGTGVALVNTQYCEVRDCHIHRTLREGVMVKAEDADDSTDSSHNVVAGNRIDYAGAYAGIVVNGAFQTLYKNDIAHTVQHPLYPTLSTADGADADGIKFCGRDIVIRGNYIHDLSPSQAGNVDPHVDAMQTFGPAYGILIEHNHINLPTSEGETQAAMIEQIAAPVRDIVIRYNIVTAFRGFNIWGYNTEADAVVPIPRVTIANNTFHGVEDYDFELHDCPDATVKNNVISASGRYMWANLPVVTSCNAVPGSLPLRSGDVRISDPMFVDPASRDFHLRPGSPLIDAATYMGYGADSDAVHVPQGVAPDIGAFEFPSPAGLPNCLIPFLDLAPLPAPLCGAK
jgi:hypothetical protein